LSEFRKMLSNCPGERWQHWGNRRKPSRYTPKEDGLACVKDSLGWLKPWLGRSHPRESERGSWGAPGRLSHADAQIAALVQVRGLSLRPAMLTISKIPELKLLTDGIINDTAEGACIGWNLVNPQLVVVFCREFSTKLIGSLAARERKEIRDFLRGSLVGIGLVQNLSEVAAALASFTNLNTAPPSHNTWIWAEWPEADARRASLVSRTASSSSASAT
jgi:hypothetical protein